MMFGCAFSFQSAIYRLVRVVYQRVPMFLRGRQASCVRSPRTVPATGSETGLWHCSATARLARLYRISLSPLSFPPTPHVPPSPSSFPRIGTVHVV